MDLIPTYLNLSVCGLWVHVHLPFNCDLAIQWCLANDIKIITSRNCAYGSSGIKSDWNIFLSCIDCLVFSMIFALIIVRLPSIISGYVVRLVRSLFGPYLTRTVMRMSCMWYLLVIHRTTKGTTLLGVNVLINVNVSTHSRRWYIPIS